MSSKAIEKINIKAVWHLLENEPIFKKSPINFKAYLKSNLTWVIIFFIFINFTNIRKIVL